MNTDIFQCNPEKFGGTEYMVREWNKRISPDLPKFADYQCWVFPGLLPTEDELDSGRRSIVWLHNPVYQLGPAAENLFKDRRFLDSIEVIVTVSEWHRTVIVGTVDIDSAKVIVIPNAIDPIPHSLDRFTNTSKIKVIHASHPDRAMQVLVPAAHMIAPEIDFELQVFNEFYPDTAGIQEDIAPIVLDPRVTYYGKTPRATVLKHMAEAHIHAYPAWDFEETSCMVQIEALATGCLTVVSDVGALPETSRKHGMFCHMTGDLDADREAFAVRLSAAITLISVGMWQPVGQSEEIMGFYSWNRAKDRWSELHDRL